MSKPNIGYYKVSYFYEGEEDMNTFWCKAVDDGHALMQFGDVDILGIFFRLEEVNRSEYPFMGSGGV